MMYPLVRDLAVDGVPVMVACRVLKISRAPYYRWLTSQVTDADWVRAHRLNALIDAHRADPEFGYRFFADEAADAGQFVSERTAWALCHTQGVFSVISTRSKGKGTRSGPPALMITFNGFSPRRHRTRSGWLTSPSTPQGKANSTCA